MKNFTRLHPFKYSASYSPPPSLCIMNRSVAIVIKGDNKVCVCVWRGGGGGMALSLKSANGLTMIFLL